MRHSSKLILDLAFLIVSAFAQTKPSHPQPTQVPVASAAAADSSTCLPVKRVVLYKNGVGYFEHTARVHGTQDLSIDFTTAQLNDVLKSLTAVDLGDGRVSSVRYTSIAPLDERLKSLRLPFGEQVTQAEYLSAFGGARVEVRSGSASALGRLLSVEKIRKQRTKDDFEDVISFSIITDAGEMRNFDQSDRLEQFAKLQSPPGVGAGSGDEIGGGVFRSANGLTGLSGLVKDPSGAGVSGAHVTVRNEETGVAQVATTDREGRYSFIDIQPGQSALLVNAPGFQRFTLSNVYIGVGRTNQIDASLNIGSASETVEVQASAPTGDTQMASLSTLSGRQVAEAEGKSGGFFRIQDQSENHNWQESVRPRADFAGADRSRKSHTLE